MTTSNVQTFSPALAGPL